MGADMKVVAIFGPTAVGKTGVAIELAELLRDRGEDPVAVNCDAMQIYRGLERINAAPSAAECERLEHRLLGIVDPAEEFSAGRFAAMAHKEIDELLAQGRRPIVVGGTGLYLRAALSELELRPPVPSEIRGAVEQELTELGPEALHGQLRPELAATVHTNDRKKIARYLELQRAGIEPPQGSTQLWTEKLRHPTLLAGLVLERGLLTDRIERRIETMAASGAGDEARRARDTGISRTAAAMIGFEAFLEGDLERVAMEHRRYARRQVTWMRKMPGVTVIDRADRSDLDLATQLLDLAVG